MMPETSPETRRHLGILRLLLIALQAGMIVFAVIAVVVGGKRAGTAGGPGFDVNILRAAAWIIVAMGFAGGFALRSAMAGQLRGRDDVTEAHVTRTLFTATILGATMMEGGGLLAAVTALRTGEASDLIPTGAAVLGIGLLFPTAGRWRRFHDAARGPGRPGG